jgi:fumarate hydratase subunit alpha
MTVLPPETAILTECAYEGERDENAAAALLRMVERFNMCAEMVTPLIDGARAFTVFITRGESSGVTADALTKAAIRGIESAGGKQTPVYVTDVTGAGVTVKVGVTDAECASYTGYLESARGDAAGKFIANYALLDIFREYAPLIVGAGIADTSEDAERLARSALYRPTDSESADASYAGLERRLLAKLNRLGAGARGLGGGHTALAVNINACATGSEGAHVAVCVGGNFTSSAAVTL